MSRDDRHRPAPDPRCDSSGEHEGREQPTMRRSGPRSSDRAGGATLGRTASRGAPTGGVGRSRSGRAARFALMGRLAAAARGDSVAGGLCDSRSRGSRLCAASRGRRSRPDRCDARLARAGCRPAESAFTRRSVARRLRAAGGMVAGRSVRRGAAAGAGRDTSPAGSTVTGSVGVGCGGGTSPVTGGTGAGTGGSGAGGGGGGAGRRAGSRPSGSTYPFGSAATRTPRWTCGCTVDCVARSRRRCRPLLPR